MKNNIKAVVVADSINEFNNRLTTLLVTMPRYILAEFNTHRMLSKNSASSRAIKFEKNLESVKNNPFMPVAWMKNHTGMQGSEYFTMDDTTDGVNTLSLCDTIWSQYALDSAIQNAERLFKAGVTKQFCNRLLEPYMWHTVLVSATEWENFFHLRCPQYTFDGTKIYRSRKDACLDIYNGSLTPENPMDEISFMGWMKLNRGQADIHMMLTAEAIWDAMNESTPKLLKAGEWHIPFGDQINPEEIVNQKDYETYSNLKIKIATARCAQTSYTVIGEDEKEMNYEKLIALHDRLAKSGHWSPFEHCAKAMNEWEMDTYKHTAPHTTLASTAFHSHGFCGNFRGFIQYRKMFAN